MIRNDCYIINEVLLENNRIYQNCVFQNCIVGGYSEAINCTFYDCNTDKLEKMTSCKIQRGK